MKMRTTRAILALTLLAAVAVVSACGSSTGSTKSPNADAVDRAFVAQMIPHHKMAVQMAQDARKMGTHPETRTIAESIIGSQAREISTLSAIAKTLEVTPAAMGMNAAMDGDAKTLGLPMSQMGMSMDMSSLKDAKPFDRAFIDEMVPHHQGAIRMARAELAKGTDPQLKQIATAIITAQRKEITEMNSWRTGWYGAASPAGGIPQP